MLNMKSSQLQTPLDSGADLLSRDVRVWVGFGGLIFALGIAALIIISPDDQFLRLIAIVTMFYMVGFLSLADLVRGRSSFEARGKAEGTDLVAIIEALPDATVLTSASGRVLNANRAAHSLLGDGASPGRLLQAALPAHEIGDGDIYNLFRAAREQRGGALTLSFDGTLGRQRRLIAVRPSGQGTSLWSFREPASEAQRPATPARPLSDVPQILDSLPTGIVASNLDGQVLFCNATLQRWLLGDENPIGPAVPPTLEGMFVESLDQIPVSGVKENTDVAIGAHPAHLRENSGQIRPVMLSRTQIGDGQGQEIILTLISDTATGPITQSDLEDVRFSRIFHDTPIGIALLGGGGKVYEANATFAELVEAPQDAKSSELLELVSTADRDDLKKRMDGVLSGTQHDDPLEVHLSGKSERIVQIYFSRMAGPEETILVAYLVDTTDQKSLELQFAQSQKMQAVGQLAGGIAHDFNNLLTAIIGFCDLLLVRHEAGDPSFGDVMQIKQNANRAANLVRQLLAFSRQQTMRPKVLHITDVLADLTNLLSRLLGEQVNLQMVHGRDFGLVKVDQGQFEQVIINLAVNARDAMPEGGTLTITTRNVTPKDCEALSHTLMPTGEYVCISVEDTGVGIGSESLGKIFEPFYTTKEVGKGTGLGLSTVYGIVKQTGGFIFPRSEVGKGTTFDIFLPSHARDTEDGSEPTAAPVTEAPAQDLTGRGTILLVEDESAVRAFAVRALQNRGYEVLEADGGEAALEILKEHDGQIDLLISDVVMPSMDGPTLVAEVSQDRPDMKIIFISGYAEDAFRKNLREGQEFAFLPKPFSLKQLASTVKAVMSA